MFTGQDYINEFSSLVRDRKAVGREMAEAGGRVGPRHRKIRQLVLAARRTRLVRLGGGGVRRRRGAQPVVGAEARSQAAQAQRKQGLVCGSGNTQSAGIGGAQGG